MWHAVVASSASRLSAPESGLGIGGHLALASGVCANRAPRFPCVNCQLPQGSDDKSLASTCLDPASPLTASIARCMARCFANRPAFLHRHDAALHPRLCHRLGPARLAQARDRDGGDTLAGDPHSCSQQRLSSIVHALATLCCRHEGDRRRQRGSQQATF